MNEVYIVYDGQNQEFAECADYTTQDIDCAKQFGTREEAEAFAEAHWPANYAVLKWM